MALEERRPSAGCIHHSDRGVQYASDDDVSLLQNNEMAVSMSRRGNPYDHAYAESFMKTLKHEEVYNKKRLHSALGYLPPDEFEVIS